MNRYPKYKPSGVEWIGAIPEHWSVIRLKYLTKNLDSKRIPLRSDDRGLKTGEYPYYGATGIIDYIDEYIFEGKYVLVGEDGAPFFVKNRDVSFVATGKFWVNNHAHILECVKRQIPELLAHQLNLVDYRKYITGSTRDKLTQSDLSEIKVIEIPIDEQTEIANFVDDKTAQIDTLIAKKQRLIKLLKEERTALINNAVTKGINPKAKLKPSSIEWLGEIPERWEVKKLKYVLDCFDSIRVPLNADERGPGEKLYDYYGASGIIDKVGEYLFNGEYILIAEDGANLLMRNSPLAFKAIGKFWVNNHAHILKPNEGNIDYFTHLLESIDYTIWVTGSAQPKLTAENLLNIDLSVPPIEEQKQIAQHIEIETQNIDSTISTIEKEIELMQEYRTALIDEVVTGKVKVV